MPESVSDVIAEARKRWTKASEAEDPQRKAILAAKKFRALEQWPDAIRIAREGAGNLAGQPAQPPRPCLVVDRLSQPVRQVSNQIKNADFGFDVMPNGGGADIDTADILKGYLRRVHNESRDESPVEWAADGAIEAGLGWFRIRTRYVHETWDGKPDDPEAYDQELVLERIPNSLSVYDDPSASKPTRSDSLYRFIVEDMDRDAFKDRFPDADMRGLDDFEGTGNMKDWVTKDTIRVAEYWRVTFTETKLSATVNGKTIARTVRKPVVKGSLINACEELEKFEWVGSRIPSVPILGEELNVDGKPVLRGVIGPGMDAQRMVNYTYSGAVEIFSLSSKNAPRVPAASIANYKSVWDTRNVYNYSYLPYDQWDENGRELRPPQDDTTEPPIQAAVALMKISEDSIKASTNTGDASLGSTNPNERSGRALEALQGQSDLANSNYPDNVRRALVYAAELMVEVIPKITRPGQILHILGMDDKPSQVMIGKPFKMNQQGQPEAAPDDITPEIAQLKESIYKFYDPTVGKYAVTVTVGKATSTRMAEGSAALGALIPHLPPDMAAAVTPDYVKQLSFPGAQGIAERLENILPPNLRPQTDGDGSMPPAAHAQIQQLTQQLQEAQQAIATKQAEKQAELQGQLQIENLKAQANHALQVELQQMKDATSIAVARINAGKAAFDTIVEAQEEKLSTGIQIAHEVREAAKDRLHDVNLAALDHVHTTLQSAQDHQQTLDQTAQAGAVTSAVQANAAEAKAMNQPAEQESDNAAETGQ